MSDGWAPTDNQYLPTVEQKTINIVDLQEKYRFLELVLTNIYHRVYKSNSYGHCKLILSIIRIQSILGQSHISQIFIAYQLLKRRRPSKVLWPSIQASILEGEKELHLSQ